MAEQASADSVAAAAKPAQYRPAVQRIRGIKAKKDKLASVNGEIADIYAKVEGLGVNRTAAKWWARLDALEPVDRMDIIRSLNGLMDASGWPETSGDLVDDAESNVVSMRLGGDGGGGGENGGAGGSGGDDDGDGDQGGGKGAVSAPDALKASRDRLGGKGREPEALH